MFSMNLMKNLQHRVNSLDIFTEFDIVMIKHLQQFGFYDTNFGLQAFCIKCSEPLIL